MKMRMAEYRELEAAMRNAKTMERERAILQSAKMIRDLDGLFDRHQNLNDNVVNYAKNLLEAQYAKEATLIRETFIDFDQPKEPGI